jgi:hypothetical protein
MPGFFHNRLRQFTYSGFASPEFCRGLRASIFYAVRPLAPTALLVPDARSEFGLQVRSSLRFDSYRGQPRAAVIPVAVENIFIPRERFFVQGWSNAVTPDAPADAPVQQSILIFRIDSAFLLDHFQGHRAQIPRAPWHIE